MKAADAGDPRGWLVLGFEYDTGKLGGDPPYWHQKAMEAYRKAANGGNCIAMMAIGDLYSRGNGVPADRTQAQNWREKAQSCQRGNLALLQQQAAQYRARAAAARDPMLDSVLADIPVIPKSPPVAAKESPAASVRSGSGFSSLEKNLVVGLGVMTVLMFALDAVLPTPSPESADFNSMQLQQLNSLGCQALGGSFDPGAGFIGSTCR
jgi:hypothetical protein